MAARRQPPPAPVRSTRNRRRLILGVVAAIGLVVGVAVAFRPHASGPPAGDAGAGAKFVDVTDRAGLRFRHVSGATGRKLLPETMGAGVAVLDFDRDGRPDLFFVNGRPWPGDPEPAGGRPTQALYRNRGDGTFEDVTAACGLDVTLYGMGVAVGDSDNDGWPDLFVTAVGGSRLFRNAAGRRFEDVTGPAGLGGGPGWPDESAADFARHADPIPFPSSAVWLDYDGDGRLDLFVGHYVTWSPAHDLGVPAVLPGGKRAYVPPQQFPGSQCRLFRNVDGTRFDDVSAAAGVLVNDGDPARPVGKALGVVVCDPDGDGRPDVVVANDTVRNFFFHNRPGPAGTRVFRETGLTAGLAYADGRPRGGMGVDAGEIAPGALAVVVANFTHEPDSLFRLQKPDPIRFTDVAADAGLDRPSQRPMKFGAVFLDYDGDGRLDLFTANGHLEPDIGLAQPAQTHAQAGQLVRNTGRPAGTFVPVTTADGRDPFPPMVGRGCAALDYDGDGRLDLVVTENGGRARLFRNETPGDNGWVRLALVGHGPGTNRDVIGASVEIAAGGTVQQRYVTAAHGYLSQCEPAVHVGLGPAAAVDRVTVRWPGADAGPQVWHDLPGGGTSRLRQGVTAAERVGP